MAAVVFDAVTEQSGTFVSSLTWTHTPVGTPTGVMVSIGLLRFGTLDTVTGVTYGGTSMVSAGTAQASSDDIRYLSWWTLASPAAGAQTVIATFSGANADGSKGAAVTVTAGDPATVFRAASYIRAASTTDAPTITVTSAVDDLVIDAVVGLGPSTVGAGQTERWLSTGGDDVNPHHWGTTKAGAASVAMSRTLVDVVFVAQVAASFKAVAAAGDIGPISMAHFWMGGAASYEAPAIAIIPPFGTLVVTGYIPTVTVAARWDCVDDGQTPAWACLNDTQAPAWGCVSDPQTPVWTKIPTS